MSIIGQARWRLPVVTLLLISPLMLSACFPPTPASGFDVDPHSATCDVIDEGDEAVLRIPLSPSAFERISLFDVTLLESAKMKISGVLIMPTSPSSPAPGSVDLSDRLRAAGTELRPPPSTRQNEPSVLTLLIARDGAPRSEAAASGIRIEWSAGEPIYYQDIPFDITMNSGCQLIPRD